MLHEYLQLEGEVEKVVGQADLAEASGAGLSFVVYPLLALLASPGNLESLPNLGMGEPDHSGLVEVVDDLAVEPVAVDDNGLEVPLIEQGPDQARHVVLGRLQGEEGRRIIRMGKARLLGDQRPEEIDHPLGQAADGEDGHLPAGIDGRPVEGIVVGRGQRALGDDDQNAPGWDARLQQVQKTGDSGGRLPCTCGSLQEEPALNRTLDEHQLVVV